MKSYYSPSPPRRQPNDADDRQGSNRWGLLILALIAGAIIMLLVSSIPLTVEQQTLFVLASLGLSLLLRPQNELARYRVIVLILISCIATGRYIFWRLTESLGWFDPNLELTFLDYLFSAGLLLAEIYAWIVLYLGYFQTVWPLRRDIRELPEDDEQWPSVDVFIPTYNEPLNVVAPTVLAALDLDWPQDKLNVYLLDDGCREEFAAFADEAGAEYIEREGSEGAKAGNINNALAQTDGDLVAIFDSDHVPTRNFLLDTVGWFLHDNDLGLLQTPHLFYTPDPVERNLQVFHQVPNEGQLFYGLVQDGNDSWNAAFFCGSCAIIRRDALEEVGGVATDTVTEDAHTSLLIQKKGWNSAYLNTPLAAGLATERLSAHIGQRRRWARGMLQIFRKDNPLLARGLTLAQRLSYFNAMLHFLFSLPRIVFLTAPLAYLYFEAYVIQASAVLIAIYALPHIFQAQVANSVMQGRYRHSFWADVYETILSPHLVRPTLTALIAPDKGSFNVTDKGGVVKEDFFDWKSAKFIFLLLVLNLVGLGFAFVRLFWWNPDETGTVLINLAWTVYNSIILGAAISVAWEKRQRREEPRVHRKYDAFVRLPNGKRIRAETRDLALSSLSLHVPPDLRIEHGDNISIEITDGNHSASFAGTAVTIAPRHLGVKLAPMPAWEQQELIYFSHGREHCWDDWYTACEPSKPLASFLEIIRLGIIGAIRAVFGHSDDPEVNARRLRRLRAAASGALIPLSALLATPGELRAETATPPVAETAEPAPRPPSGFAETRTLSFADLGVERPLKLRGGNSQDDVWFHVRADRIVKQGELRLQYSIASELLEDFTDVAITLNGQPVATIPITPENVDRPLVDVFAIDRLNFSDLNQLAFRLVPRDEENCEKLDTEAISVEIQPRSEIVLHMNPLDLINDLALFPVPFYDFRDDGKLVLPFLFGEKLGQSLPALKAGAVLASWFGAKADYLGASFPVYTSPIPLQHAVVFRTPGSQFAGLSSRPIEGPSVEVLSHPLESSIKLLLVSGRTPEELVIAVEGLVSGQLELHGSQISVDTDAFSIAPRKPYDAPRWLHDQDKTYLSELIAPGKLIARGISPKTIRINFRMAPDLLIWQNERVPLHLGYSYSDLPLQPGSTLDIGLNGDWLASYSLDGQSGKRPEIDAETSEAEAPMIRKQTIVELPVRRMIGLNQISFYPNLILPEEAARQCADIYVRHMTTAIDRDSYIDLSDHYHFARLPDLAKFANLGFPFTRYADLQETAVILPAAPDNDEIQFLLNVMGITGAATGFPAFGVTLLYPDDVDAAAEKDILLIGSDDRQPLAERWRDHMALNRDGEGNWTLRELSLFERLSLWWKGEKLEDLTSAARIIEANSGDMTALSGFQSPLDSDRSVVMLVSSSPAYLRQLNEALSEPKRLALIQGDLTVFSGDIIRGFRVLPSYYLGDLPWYTKIRWYLSTHILAMILLTLVTILVIALALKLLLSEHARERVASR